MRQHCNLSFARIYQAGHLVPAYVPELSNVLLMRALLNKDIATGMVDLQEHDWNYTSKGPNSTWRVLNDVLPMPQPECYVLWPSSCEDETWERVIKGDAIVKDWVVVGFKDDDESKLANARIKVSQDSDQAVLNAAKIGLWHRSRSCTNNPEPSQSARAVTNSICVETYEAFLLSYTTSKKARRDAIGVLVDLKYSFLERAHVALCAQWQVLLCTCPIRQQPPSPLYTQHAQSPFPPRLSITLSSYKSTTQTSHPSHPH